MNTPRSTRLRLLAFNHFFEQDLASIRDGLAESDELEVIDYRRLHRLATRCFPKAAFQAVDSADDPSFVKSWTRFRPRATAFAEWLAAAYRPSVFVVPNDTFFYLRPVIMEFRRLGVPTVCVQKETTIAPLTMEIDSETIRRSVPPIVDMMAVCSERHRDFAIRCGADPSTVVVTGQPRFDVYAHVRARPPRAGTSSTLLYLSFDDLAYLPPDAEATGIGTWRPLRHDVEDVLARMSRSGRWRILAKTHPQQQALDDRLGEAVTRVPRGTDTRELVAEADVVVGFQTTTLFEAAVAGKPVLYPAWGDAFEATLPLLIPFHEHPEMVTHVRSASALEAALEGGLAALERPGEDARGFAEVHLGPVDGQATPRVVALLRTWASHEPPSVPSPPLASQMSAWAVGIGAPALRALSPLPRLVGRADLSDAVRRRATAWAQQAAEGRTIRSRASA